MLKASPVSDGERRLLFFEASNEDLDHDNEVILAKALHDSSGFFLRHGNVDLSHITLTGPKMGISNHLEYEVGRPVDVCVDGKRTFVKAELYRGTSPMAKNADMVWQSLTEQFPPARWYPSVGGSVLEKGIDINPDTGQRTTVIRRVLWNNIALDRCPVNKTVGEVSTIPVAVFKKSVGGFLLVRALEAGYGTDSAALVGGGALRSQSLDGKVQSQVPIYGYWDFEDRLAADLRNKRTKGVNLKDLVRHAVDRYGLSGDDATRWVSRFMDTLQRHYKARKYSNERAERSPR